MVDFAQVKTKVGYFTPERFEAQVYDCEVQGKIPQDLNGTFFRVGGDWLYPPKFPDGEVEGVGTHEAPRGTLSHWVVLRNGRLSNYQAVVPTTWNASPRDNRGVPGPYESSLLGNPVIDGEKPLEVLRTVHSFDPCMACACHAFDPSGKQIVRVKVL